jgi:RHS repeat-associated protein
MAESYGRSGAHLHKQYVWGLRYIDAPILRDRETDAGSAGLDERLYYTQDGNFNVTALVNTDGTVAERIIYSPYGQPTFLKADWTPSNGPDGQNNTPDDGTASDFHNRILYCGYRFDSETGLYHVRHRYLHPALGRWTSQDPAGYVDGLSLYEYCRSGPVYISDPYGRDSKNVEASSGDPDGLDSTAELTEAQQREIDIFNAKQPNARLWARRTDDYLRASGQQGPRDRAAMDSVERGEAALRAERKNADADTWKRWVKDDVYKIQTILANNEKKLDLDRQDIDGSYDRKTKTNVCKLEKYLSKKYSLGTWGGNGDGIDGRWTDETHRAFVKAEKAGDVNWRYAHVKIGTIVKVDMHTVDWLANVGTDQESVSGSLSLKGTLWSAPTTRSLTGVPATYMEERTSGSGVMMGIDFLVVVVWARPGSLTVSDTGYDWSVNLGPLKSKHVKMAKKMEAGIEALEGLSKLKGQYDKMKRYWKMAETLTDGKLWRGGKGMIVIPTVGYSFGGYAGTTKTTIMSKGL